MMALHITTKVRHEMEVRFFLTREDLWHSLTYLSFRRHRRLFVLWLLMYAILILMAVLLNVNSFSLISLLILLMLLILPVFPVLRLRRRASREAGKGGEHVVSITPEDIREKTDLGEGTRFWRTIKTVTQDQYNLYLIIDTMGANVMAAMVIPRRAFAAPQAAEMFLDQARQYWIHGRGIPPATIPGISPLSGEKMPPNHKQ